MSPQCRLAAPLVIKRGERRFTHCKYCIHVNKQNIKITKNKYKTKYKNHLLYICMPFCCKL